MYGAITAEGAIAAEGPLEGGVSGLGTAVHAVRFGGGGVAAGQAGEIALRAGLVGRAPQGGNPVRVCQTTPLPCGAGETARTVAPSGQAPVVAVYPGSFVRVVDVAAAGDSARPAIDVAALAAAAPAAPPPGPGAPGMAAAFPPGGVRMIASSPRCRSRRARTRRPCRPTA